jgi:hypothetical protein
MICNMVPYVYSDLSSNIWCDGSSQDQRLVCSLRTLAGFEERTEVHEGQVHVDEHGRVCPTCRDNSSSLHRKVRSREGRY